LCCVLGARKSKKSANVLVSSKMQLVVRYVGDYIVHAYFPKAYNLWVSVANACDGAIFCILL